MDDDLSIPAFLRREVTPVTKAAVTRINNELRSGGRRIERTGGRSSISAGHALNLDDAGQALLKEITTKERKREEHRKREAFALLRALREEKSAMSKKVGKKERSLRKARAQVDECLVKPFEEAIAGEVTGSGRIKRTGKKKAELAPPVVMVDDASMATSPIVEAAPEAPAPAPAKKAKAKKAKPVPLGDIRKGSKLETIAGLLQRPEGCTTAEVLKATKWQAVSMPQMARDAGLKLRKVKDGKVTRYYAI